MASPDSSAIPPVRYPRPAAGTQPPYLHPPYVASTLRAPTRPLIVVPHTISELTGPHFTAEDLKRSTCDLTAVGSGRAVGERIVVSGRVVDEADRPVRQTLIEIWQANAAGRYLHRSDQHHAPLDPFFCGRGHVITDDQGRYRFVTVKPGAYPWGNHPNAWRPAHIHFSVFGNAFITRLVTQMYFPGDPLLPCDPIFNCTDDEQSRNRLISLFDWETTIPAEALGFRFDIVLNGREATPREEHAHEAGR